MTIITRIRQLRRRWMPFKHKKHVISRKPTRIGVDIIVWQFLKMLLGLSIYSFGVYLTIYANIGLAPWDCLGMGIAKHTPLNYGSSMVLIGVCAIIIQLLLQERIGFATVFDALLTGNIVQVLTDISPYPENHSLSFSFILNFNIIIFRLREKIKFFFS